MGCIIKWSGVGTLEDYRRFRDYDADKTVDRFLNKPAVKASPAPAHTIHIFNLYRALRECAVFCEFPLVGRIALTARTHACWRSVLNLCII